MRYRYETRFENQRFDDNKGAAWDPEELDEFSAWENEPLEV